MKRIILLAIIFSLMVLFLGYAFAYLQGGSAPADTIGSYKSSTDHPKTYDEMSSQEIRDNLGRYYEVDEPADKYSDTYDE